MQTTKPIVNVNGRIYNVPALVARRKDLRRKMTESEKLVWEALRNRKLRGFKFRRQYGLGGYVLDFYCPGERLNVELDGSQHYTQQGKAEDTTRDEYLRGLNIHVLRFENGKVLGDLQSVLDRILDNLNALDCCKRSNLPLTPSLSKEGGSHHAVSEHENGEDGTLQCQTNAGLNEGDNGDDCMIATPLISQRSNLPLTPSLFKEGGSHHAVDEHENVEAGTSLPASSNLPETPSLAKEGASSRALSKKKCMGEVGTLQTVSEGELYNQLGTNEQTNTDNTNQQPQS